MTYFLKDAKIYENGTMNTRSVFFDGAVLSPFFSAEGGVPRNVEIIENCIVLPGFCDVHVHFREPGFSYKETMESGTAAAAHGGYTAVLTMPNLDPAPDGRAGVEAQLAAIERGARVNVYPYGTISRGELGRELSDMEEIAGEVIAFSDDGRGVQSPKLMEEAMVRARALGKVIAAHCEDNELLRGGYIHDGEYAARHGHRGICSESEYGQIRRDLELVRRTGAAYHVCHVSAKESVALIREAKREGLDVTCETAPHYLTLDEGDLEEDGRFKMNPPLRSSEDREALVAGILDGTIDMIATDHAPHSAEEKGRGLAGSLMGVVGLETAFPVLYTRLVETETVPVELIVRLLCDNPRRRFRIKGDAGFTVFQTGVSERVKPSEFLSKGRATPFEGHTVHARCLATVLNGKTVYKDEKYFGG